MRIGSKTDLPADPASPAKDNATLAAEREARKANRSVRDPMAGWVFDDANPAVYKVFPAESTEEALKHARRALVLAKRSNQALELAFDGASSVTLRLPTENGKAPKQVRAFARKVERSPKNEKSGDAAGAEAPAEG